MNPAYMTRQANELSQVRLGIYGHLTSLDPLRPGNAPDAWEAQALQRFESGVKEVSSVERMNGKDLMRLMRPHFVEPECLTCHAKQGYKVGEIRGGLSVSVDMQPSMTLLNSTRVKMTIGHLLLWFTGIGALLLRARLMLRRAQDRWHVAETLQQINYDLEQRVAERTAELAESNRLLEEDIRERVAAVEEREALTAQLRQAQKMEVIGTLAGGIAHDFNNLLTPIIGYAELASQRSGTSEKVLNDLQRIFGAAERAKGLVRQILAFSRQKEQAYHPVSMQQLIQEVLDLVRPTIPKTIRIVDVLPEGNFLVEADPVQLHQVLMNLCTNAWQAMQDQNGTLQLTLEALVNTDTLPGLAAGEYIRLKVSDTGCGMDDETLEKIFDPFFTTKKVGEGTGLGLAVVQGILHNHGGIIKVESVLEQGSCFSIYLPQVRFAELVPEQQLPVVANGERILLVDDEPEIVKMLVDGLNKSGFQVSGFSSSQAALTAFREQPFAFDLLLSDRTMPELTGQQLADAVWAFRPTLPVLFMTGYDLSSDGQIDMAEMSTPCLTKPLTTSETARQIARMLTTQGSMGGSG